MSGDFDLPNFDDDFFSPEPIVIPDTVEEVLEAWQKDEEVKQALKDQAEAEREAAEAQQIIESTNNEIAELEKKITALKNKQFQARAKFSTIDRKKRRADQIISVAKQNYEARQAEAKKLAEVRDFDTTQFAWGSGIEVGGKTLKILPHQTLAAEIIAAYGNIILADEMGVGKTLSMIAAMDYAKVKRALVVCPADVTSNFLKEIQMWAPHRHCVDMRGMSKNDRNAIFGLIGNLPNFVIVTNYESWRRDKSVLESLLSLELEQIFMDEAHVMKNKLTNAYSGMKHVCHTPNICATCKNVLPEDIRGFNKLCPTCGGYEQVSSVRSIIPATGTPILNSPGDIFTLLNLIDPRYFDNEYDFLNNYAERDYYTGTWKFRPGGEKSLLTRLGYRFIKRTMDDVGIELPQQQIIHHELEWGDYENQQAAYEELTKFGEILIGGEDEWGNLKKVSAASVLAQITRQRQCTVWPAGIQIKNEDGVVIASVGDRVNESVKVDKAISIIEEAYLRNERIVVFSQFATGLAELEKRLGETPIRAVRFDGSTTQKVKEEVKNNFNASLNEDAKWDVVLANYRTGGVGLNLTACTTMVFLDMEWNPGKENQALKRVHRIGQEKRTFVHVLSVTRTVDTWMRGLITDKQNLLDGFNSEQKTLQEQYLEGIKSGEV